MIKLLAINTTFRDEIFYARWRFLAQKNKDLDVSLVGPSNWKNKAFGKDIEWKPECIDEDRFRVFHINMPNNKWTYLINGMVSLDIFKVIKKVRPDVIYLIGYETDNLVLEISILKKMFVPKAKIIGFTMRGLDMPVKTLRFKIPWFFTSKIFDAYFCHYPHGKNVLLEQGKFKKPVYMQTQIGVNGKTFRPNVESRMKVRRKYNITDSEFVFGSASRIDSEKGIFDIINGLPEKGSWKFMMLGDGIDFIKVKKAIEDKGLQDNVILTGYVKNGEGVAEYMNAMDCFIHVPRTTKTWIDTFPLAVVQAMATGLAVIGSTSGAVSYQLGKDGIIIPERSPEALKKEMIKMINKPESAREIGNKNLKRVHGAFEIEHLNKCFNELIRQTMIGEYDSRQIDQTNFYFKY